MLRCLHLLSLAYTQFNVLVITYGPSTIQPFAVSLTYSTLHTISLTRTYQHFNVSFSLDTSLQFSNNICNTLGKCFPYNTT